MHATSIKEAAYRLVDQLPDDATWDDLMRKAYEPATVREPAHAVAQGTSEYSPTLVVPCRHSREGGNPVTNHASAEFPYKPATVARHPAVV